MGEGSREAEKGLECLRPVDLILAYGPAEHLLCWGYEVTRVV